MCSAYYQGLIRFLSPGGGYDNKRQDNIREYKGIQKVGALTRLWSRLSKFIIVYCTYSFLEGVREIQRTVEWRAVGRARYSNRGSVLLWMHHWLMGNLFFCWVSTYCYRILCENQSPQLKCYIAFWDTIASQVTESSTVASGIGSSVSVCQLLAQQARTASLGQTQTFDRESQFTGLQLVQGSLHQHISRVLA